MRVYVLKEKSEPDTPSAFVRAGQAKAALHGPEARDRPSERDTAEVFQHALPHPKWVALGPICNATAAAAVAAHHAVSPLLGIVTKRLGGSGGGPMILDTRPGSLVFRAHLYVDSNFGFERDSPLVYKVRFGGQTYLKSHRQQKNAHVRAHLACFAIKVTKPYTILRTPAEHGSGVVARGAEQAPRQHMALVGFAGAVVHGHRA